MIDRSRLLVALLALVAMPARADTPPDDEARARAHYEVGVGLYHLGKYRDAIKEFSAGYQLSRRPKFLVNLGQAYRRLDELTDAREMFARFLAEAPADAEERPVVQQLLAEVEQRIAVSPPRAPPVEPQPSLLVTSPTPPKAEAGRRGGWRRYWWIAPVAAAVAGGAAVGIYFAVRPTACSGADIGCLDLQHR